MCGKDMIFHADQIMLPGSPPHVRERQVNVTPLVSAFGITPACAGKTTYMPNLLSAGWDHPRMCGKDTRPLMTCRKRSWITPACAGKTLLEIQNCHFGRDHPRMCGKDSLLPIV